MSADEECVAVAIKDELDRQGVLYAFDGEDRADLSRFAMFTGEYADLRALAAAVLAAKP
jgi:hypothetical protein